MVGSASVRSRPASVIVRTSNTLALTRGYKMTKKQAEQLFRSEVLPSIVEQERNGRDGPRRAEAWNNWTDMLCKDGQITDWQYTNWHHPRWL